MYHMYPERTVDERTENEMNLQHRHGYTIHHLHGYAAASATGLCCVGRCWCVLPPAGRSVRMQNRHRTSEAPSVEDDSDGHLIYRVGDVLQARCTHIFIVTRTFSSPAQPFSRSGLTKQKLHVHLFPADFIWTRIAPFLHNFTHCLIFFPMLAYPGMCEPFISVGSMGITWPPT